MTTYSCFQNHTDILLQNCQDKFIEVAESPKFRYIGNTTVGKDVQLTELAQNYNSLLFAYGSAHEQGLNVPGETLPGVYSARQFVGWYNGLPELAGLNPPLEDCETVSVIGNGNVALDVARVLLCNPDTRLKATDITEEAYEVLKKSRVRHVRVVGRRGILQSAFTTKEIRELVNEPGVSMTRLQDKYIEPYRAFIPKLNRVKKRMVQVLDKASQEYDPMAVQQRGDKTFSLDYLLSPTQFFEGSRPNILAATEFQVNVLQQDDLMGPANAVRTNETVTLPNELVFKSIGYKAVPIDGMDKLGIQFDSRRGLITNSYGRVLVSSPQEKEPTPGKGLYVTGWVKTGPTGVIASTMREAFEVAEVIIEDYQNGALDKTRKPGFDGVKDRIAKSTRVVSWADWEAIDRAEVERGREVGKPRSKLASVQDMLRVLE